MADREHITITDFVGPRVVAAKTVLVLGATDREIDSFPVDNTRISREFDPGKHYDLIVVLVGGNATQVGHEVDLDSDQRIQLFERLAGSVTRDGRVWLIAREGTPSKLPASGELVSRQLVAAAARAGLTILGDQRLNTESRSRAFECRPGSHRIRSYRPGDDSQILDLFTRCFHHTRDPQHWQWKYHRNPWLNRRISLAFDQRNELLAHYAGYGVPLWDRGVESFAIHMGDTMTDPEARTVGRRQSSLLARTVRHFFAEFREPRIDLFFGFNTGPIQRFCRWFIGGGQVDEVTHWHSNATRSVQRKAPWNQVGIDPPIDSSFDRLFATTAADYTFLVRRDRSYLDWRYRQCPDHDYRILTLRRFGRLVGWSVFERVDDRLIWGDALFDRRHARSAAAAILATATEAFDCNAIEAWFAPHPAWWVELLEPLGFERGPEPQSLAMMALDNDRELDLANFYYTKGDSDLF